MKNNPQENLLGKSHSLYLLQHAHNPVHWQPWSEESLALAKDMDKPLLISIGYAACHWCHVMAHETFEDEASARIMNDHFICIKVDREERPDIDAVYMQAVQMMTGSGGWPLHVFALPDGRPFFGGTYFPREQWQHICRSVNHEFENNREKLSNFADKLGKGLQVRVPVINSPITTRFDQGLVSKAVENLQDHFDNKHGGFLGAPKFPMPALLDLLHDYGLVTNNDAIQYHLRHTLNRITMGGIYDHVGGGFSRYSVDSRWKVPHFEKMLYDNAQMLSLLCKTYRTEASKLYEERIRETADFILRDLITREGLFASSIDADSEGIEGQFYIWDEAELKNVLGSQFPLAKTIFSIDAYGSWENNKVILQMQHDYETQAQRLKVPLEDLHESVHQIKKRLFLQRQKRTLPARDEKMLISWNGLAIQALINAAIALDQPQYVAAAQQAAGYIIENLRMESGGLFHVFSQGHAYTSGFLDDYSHMIRALIALYQVDLDEKWLHHAQTLMQYVFKHFLDAETGFFYFTTDDQSALIKRDINLTDGVIPSANSVLGHALLDLSRFFEKTEWESHARKMAANMGDELASYPRSYSHWASLYLRLTIPSIDVVVSGKLAEDYVQQLQQTYHPGVLFAGSINESSLPILSDRFKQNQTQIYICRDKVCSEPVQNIQDARQMIYS